MKLFSLALTVAALSLQVAVAGPGKHKPVPRASKISKATRPPKLNLPPSPVEGVWTLRSGDQENKAVRFTFRRDGTWEYRSSDSRSAGRFTLVDKTLTLLWSDVDGEPIALGSMKKELTLNEDKNSYLLDKWLYSRSITKVAGPSKPIAKR